MGDIYQIGIKISMVNGVSPALALISAKMFKLDKQVAGLVGRFGDLGSRAKLAIGGGLSLYAGDKVLRELGHVANAGEKLLDQQDKLQRAGMSLNDVLKVQKDFYSNIAKSIPTASADEFLKSFNEMRSVYGVDQALSKAPRALMIDALIGNAIGKSADGQGFALKRALEMRGTTTSDPIGSDRLEDAMMKVIIGSAGKINAGTFQAMAKTGGAAYINASPQFLTGAMSVVAGDLGGDRAGTAMMTLYQLLSGATTLSKQQYAVMKQAGLIDPSKVSTDKGGRLNARPGAIIGSDLGMHDAEAWVKMITPKLMKAAGGNEEVFHSMLAKIGRNRNATRMMEMFSSHEFADQISKDKALWAQSHGVEQSYQDFTTNNPKGVKEAFHKQEESLMQAIGAPIMQAALPVMKSVTEMFTKIGALANMNPDIVSGLGKGIAALGVGLVGGGGVALLAALGPAGWIALGIGAVSAAVVLFHEPLEKFASAAAKLAIAGWDSIVSGITSFIAKIKDLIASLAQFNPFSLTTPGAVRGVTPENPTGYVSPKAGRQHSSLGIPPYRSRENVTHVVVNLDGEVVHRSVERRMVRDSSFARRAPVDDSFGHFAIG